MRKMNTKILMISLIVVSILMFGSVLAASAQTILNYNWNGVGQSSVTFDTGDAQMGFQTFGVFTGGSLYAVDFDDNPYNYGVDSFKTNLNANVNNGYIVYEVNRTDSKTSMYGPADQATYSCIGSTGDASLVFQTSTNYAALGNHNYGFQSNNQFVASGEYYATHTVNNGLNNAGFEATGLGTLDVDHMNDDTWVTGITFGAGGGCYTNANVEQTGLGTFGIGAHFENSFTMGGVTAGGIVNYSEGYSFTDGFSWTNYSFSGN